jgi:hypothetical protein
LALAVPNWVKPFGSRSRKSYRMPWISKGTLSTRSAEKTFVENASPPRTKAGGRAVDPGASSTRVRASSANLAGSSPKLPG